MQWPRDADIDLIRAAAVNVRRGRIFSGVAPGRSEVPQWKYRSEYLKRFSL
jgi:hypothetical protein